MFSVMYIWLSAFAKHGFPSISNRDSILFHSGCAGISIALLDRTVSWPWNVRETSTRVVGQSCSSFSNGSFLCFARGSSIIIRIRTISWFSHACKCKDQSRNQGVAGQETEKGFLG
ncbi:hypothetical protein PVK06_037391 [Gossypium arboreum]|uniref:Uncharacterized protein n=1 Tax=Gossypium arboreum TaxID=29729 RepID=A0ABR0MXE5_GOSAR|nr:hypothetical protein PVK06_037391 [Gossypium arboreum]